MLSSSLVYSHRIAEAWYILIELHLHVGHASQLWGQLCPLQKAITAQMPLAHTVHKLGMLF